VRAPIPREADDRRLLHQFALERDEAAFAALVRRHGPMVFSVCRRHLGNLHDAEDAFQATFLILSRKAATLRQPDLLANWLYGVAYRVATKARGRAEQRQAREKQLGTRSRADSYGDSPGWELRAVLDEELQRLPDKYRAPLVLCYLEGKTNAEAAHELGWPAGSMSSRLARGRALLRERLTHLGLVLSGIIGAIS
jgi:RNA polymerase sigma factor (sigma-70 family)